MREQQPTSEQLRTLLATYAPRLPLLVNVRLEAALQPLYARMQAEEAERAQMHGLLKLLVQDFDPLFESYSSGPDEWVCPLCHQATPATYDPPGQLAPAPAPFPHAQACPIAQGAGLLATDTGNR